LTMTQTKDLGITASFTEISEQLLTVLEEKLNTCLTQ
jgi:hypothetical protein